MTLPRYLAAVLFTGGLLSLAACGSSEHTLYMERQDALASLDAAHAEIAALDSQYRARGWPTKDDTEARIAALEKAGGAASPRPGTSGSSCGPG